MRKFCWWNHFFSPFFLEYFRLARWTQRSVQTGSDRKWWRVRFFWFISHGLAPDKQLLIYVVLFFSFRFVSHRLYGRFAMETRPLCLLFGMFRILRWRCRFGIKRKKKTKKQSQLALKMCEAISYICIFFMVFLYVHLQSSDVSDDF